MNSKELHNFFKEYSSKNPPKLESNQEKLSYITKEEILHRLNNSPRIHHKKYKLLFEDGFFFLINTSDNTDLILPNRIQWGYKHKDPNIFWHKALEIMDKKGAIIHDRHPTKKKR